MLDEVSSSLQATESTKPMLWLKEWPCRMKRNCSRGRSVGRKKERASEMRIVLFGTEGGREGGRKEGGLTGSVLDGTH